MRGSEITNIFIALTEAQTASTEQMGGAQTGNKCQLDGSKGEMKVRTRPDCSGP